MVPPSGAQSQVLLGAVSPPSSAHWGPGCCPLPTTAGPPTPQSPQALHRPISQQLISQWSPASSPGARPSPGAGEAWCTDRQMGWASFREQGREGPRPHEDSRGGGVPLRWAPAPCPARGSAARRKGGPRLVPTVGRHPLPTLPSSPSPAGGAAASGQPGSGSGKSPHCRPDREPWVSSVLTVGTHLVLTQQVTRSQRSERLRLSPGEGWKTGVIFQQNPQSTPTGPPAELTRTRADPPAAGCGQGHSPRVPAPPFSRLRQRGVHAAAEWGRTSRRSLHGSCPSVSSPFLLPSRLQTSLPLEGPFGRTSFVPCA